ncbi:IS200/IS605 family transposase [Nocardia yunnanensis]|uniref:IS200/IS605 family transposase n=1 Tax=Nocardia yunnanensis TaxID=2382165 RepID=A0A386ZG31_9NOCA|nr:IS200/IS605 family transposase [Nocardia yunnanensis]AYF76410.1 IS200/IS605 family transposase [Nocardia yunnanensis]
MDEIRSNNQIVYRCVFDVVWCTKYRRPVIDASISERLAQIVHNVCVERHAQVAQLETYPDHVRLAVSCDPQLGIHRLVKQIKSRTSQELRTEFSSLCSRLPTLWTNSYFVATVGGATTEAVKHYVAQQPKN